MGRIRDPRSGGVASEAEGDHADQWVRKPASALTGDRRRGFAEFVQRLLAARNG